MTKQLLSRADFRFFHRLRVRWAEVDMQKIVFNPHYLMYFDTAIGDYWRLLAFPYEAGMHRLGGDLYVKKAGVEYHASARYDDQLDIGLRCERIGNSSLQFRGGVFRGEQLLVEGELIYVYANPATQKSQPVPQVLRDLLLDYEAGQAVVEVRLGAWEQLREAAREVRTEVFLQEQQIPVQLEWDDDDATALHAVAFNRLGMPVATGRLLQATPQVARIGRMAVTRMLRGSGLGRELLRALMQAAAQRGDREVMLHAQRSAESFYAQQGFMVRGQPFEEAGIPHIEMFRRLD
jgi:YbgC/YbaW family acyl-CoA thioester hydrolase